MKAANFIRVIFVVLLTACITPLVCGQIRSDEKKGCYTDNTLHFHWYLPGELKWKFMPGIEPHTVFRAVAKSGITVTVSVREIEGAEEGISSDGLARFLDVDIQRDITEMVLNKQKQHDGTVGIIIDVSKCRYAGKDAIKAITLHKYKDDVRSVNYYVQSYRTIHDGCTWQMTIKCTDELWRLLGESGRKKLFQGFGFNTKPERTQSANPQISENSNIPYNSAKNGEGHFWNTTSRMFIDISRNLKWDLSEGNNWYVLPDKKLPKSVLFSAIDDTAYSVKIMYVKMYKTDTTIWSYSEEWVRNLLLPLMMGFDETPGIVYIEPVFMKVMVMGKHAWKCQIKPDFVKSRLANNSISKSMEFIAFFLGDDIMLVSTVLLGTQAEIMDNNKLAKYSLKLTNLK